MVHVSYDMPHPPVAVVLETDREWRSVLGGEMLRLGYLVLPVQSAEEAVEHLRHLPAGTLLIVGRLGRANGLGELLSRVAEVDPSLEVVILSGTAHALAQDGNEHDLQVDRGRRELLGALAALARARRLPPDHADRVGRPPSTGARPPTG